MKGEIRFAVACVDGFYTKKGHSPIWRTRFTDYRKSPTMILDVKREDKDRIKKVYTYDMEWRSIWRREFVKPLRVLVIGQTYMRVGYRQWGGEEEGCYFGDTDQIKVYRVVPFPKGNDRYYKPLEALLLDLMIVEKYAQEVLND